MNTSLGLQFTFLKSCFLRGKKERQSEKTSAIYPQNEIFELLTKWKVS